MRGVNSVTIIGTLGANPDVKYAANGNAIANLSIATSEEWVDKNSGQKQQKTEWHRVVLFGRTAEVAAQYLQKGSQVYIKGKLQTRKWKDQSNQDRYTTEVVVDFSGEMQMLGSKNSSPQETGFSGNPQRPTNQGSSPKTPVGEPMGGNPNASFESDDLSLEIPF